MLGSLQFLHDNGGRELADKVFNLIGYAGCLRATDVEVTECPTTDKLCICFNLDGFEHTIQMM